MMKKIRKFAALVLTLCVLASLAAPALAASGVQSELQGSAAYMLVRRQSAGGRLHRRRVGRHRPGPFRLSGPRELL